MRITPVTGGPSRHACAAVCATRTSGNRYGLACCCTWAQNSESTRAASRTCDAKPAAPPGMFGITSCVLHVDSFSKKGLGEPRAVRFWRPEGGTKHSLPSGLLGPEKIVTCRQCTGHKSECAGHGKVSASRQRTALQDHTVGEGARTTVTSSSLRIMSHDSLRKVGPVGEQQSARSVKQRRGAGGHDVPVQVPWPEPGGQEREALLRDDVG